MDTRTGEIKSEDFVKALSLEERIHYMRLPHLPTSQQMKRKPPKIGRNDICPCGSGKKFKKCHLGSVSVLNA
jgi:uncharacterized protein YecA (UPF0149 family)